MKVLYVGRRPVPWVSTHLLVLIGSIVFVNMRDVAGVLVALNSQKQLAVEWTILHLLHWRPIRDTPCNRDQENTQGQGACRIIQTSRLIQRGPHIGGQPVPHGCGQGLGTAVSNRKKKIRHPGCYRDVHLRGQQS